MHLPTFCFLRVPLIGIDNNIDRSPKKRTGLSNVGYRWKQLGTKLFYNSSVLVESSADWTMPNGRPKIISLACQAPYRSGSSVNCLRHFSLVKNYPDIFVTQVYRLLLELLALGRTLSKSPAKTSANEVNVGRVGQRG